MEEWKPIEGFPDYMVSNLGRVKGKYGKFIAFSTSPEGYKKFNVYSGTIKSRKTLSLHRVLACAFLEKNTDNNLSVDHINRNPDDNSISNLRWADKFIQSQNRRKKKLSNIYKQVNSTFLVRIKRFNQILVEEVFETLEEAIAYRDAILSQIPTTP